VMEISLPPKFKILVYEGINTLSTLHHKKSLRRPTPSF
jgi:hypothetical protein